MWSGNRAELACWNATQQFYCDALALGSRLLIIERDGRRRPKPLGRLRRHGRMDGASSYSFAQAVVNAVEQAVPNLLEVRPVGSLLAWLIYVGRCSLFTRPRFDWSTMLQHARRFYRCGGLASLSGVQGDAHEVHGLQQFWSDDKFFDSRTGQTRHNIILVFSHRHVVLDLAFLALALEGHDSGVVGNEAFLPKSAVRDPRIVLVSPSQGCAMDATLAKCANVLVEQRLPLVIAVDGGGPYLLYGQQMRVKRGIRLIIEYLKKRGGSAGRKTYIVPLSFNDVVSLVKGLDQRVKITLHKPICSDDIAPPIKKPDPELLNWGDPLLNHLELLFLVHTGQVRHGWRTPRVIETTRRVHRLLQEDHSFRGRLRRLFHVSISDLSRDQMAWSTLDR